MDDEDIAFPSGCPVDGSAVCGFENGTAPDGQVLQRPFRMGHRMCKPECVCDEPFEVVFKSCVETDIEYLYTEALCQPVYKIDTIDDTAYLNTGVSYLYSPLDTDSFDKPIALGPAFFDSFCSEETSGTCPAIVAGEPYTIGGVLYNNFAPEMLTFPTTSTRKKRTISMTGTPFTFYGVDYTEVNLFDDGYLCFGDYNVPEFKNVAQTYDAHFGGGKPCFSFLQTPMGSASGYSFKQCYKNKKHPGGDWEADSTTYTFEAAPLEGSQYLVNPAYVTVQVALIFPNQIRVSYKNIAPSTTAVIGPSNGTGIPEGFLEAPPVLPRRCESGVLC